MFGNIFAVHCTVYYCTDCSDGFQSLWPARATARKIVRWLGMTEERRKFGDRDGPDSAHQLRRLMSEVVSLREKVAQAELATHRYGLLNGDEAELRDRRLPTQLRRRLRHLSKTAASRRKSYSS
jgi:hypothetical protein